VHTFRLQHRQLSEFKVCAHSRSNVFGQQALNATASGVGAGMQEYICASLAALSTNQEMMCDSKDGELDTTAQIWKEEFLRTAH